MLKSLRIRSASGTMDKWKFHHCSQSFGLTLANPYVFPSFGYFELSITGRLFSPVSNFASLLWSFC